MAKAPAGKGAKTSAAFTPASSAAKASPKPNFAIDTDLVRAIALLLSETNVGEIEVKKGDLKVRVARHSPAATPAPVMMAATPAPVSAPSATPVAKTASSAATEAAAHPGAVKSPMVGTAYRKPSPDTKNFVELGSSVKAGEKIMLIEAMKTFNDIAAPKAGTVTAILIEDGQPVEFGQTLFVIE